MLVVLSMWVHDTWSSAIITLNHTALCLFNQITKTLAAFFAPVKALTSVVLLKRFPSLTSLIRIHWLLLREASSFLKYILQLNINLLIVYHSMLQEIRIAFMCPTALFSLASVVSRIVSAQNISTVSLVITYSINANWLCHDFQVFLHEILYFNKIICRITIYI